MLLPLVTPRAVGLEYSDTPGASAYHIKMGMLSARDSWLRFKRICLNSDLDSEGSILVQRGLISDAERAPSGGREDSIWVQRGFRIDGAVAPSLDTYAVGAERRKAYGFFF